LGLVRVSLSRTSPSACLDFLRGAIVRTRGRFRPHFVEALEPLGDEPVARLVEMLVAAEMEALETPYVVVSQRADGQISAIEGPYLDVVSALRDADRLTSSRHEPGMTFVVTSLWPPTSRPEPPPFEG